MKAVIFGCRGPVLTNDERAFFRDADPLGFILFARNIETPEQVRRLTDELRACVGRRESPILVDQEGGRVARLRPPYWRKAPPGRVLGELYARDREAGLEAARLNARLLALDVAAAGCDVDCLPVLDIAVPGAHSVIGDRAYAEQPQAIAAIGRAIAEGLMAEGVMPVMKHIPGHGRAMVDSHHAAPVVTQSRAALERSDFLPFKLLADLPWAMTAHVIYQAVDPDAVLTVSARGVQEVVRGHIGFDGLLLSDDLSMQALGGSLGERAAKVLAAGCDIALHCNGEWPEMLEVAGHAGAMTERAVRRFEDSRRTVSRHRSAQGARETRKRLTELLPEWG